MTVARPHGERPSRRERRDAATPPTRPAPWPKIALVGGAWADLEPALADLTGR